MDSDKTVRFTRICDYHSHDASGMIQIGLNHKGETE
jgi:hypothetical protein